MPTQLLASAAFFVFLWAKIGSVEWEENWKDGDIRLHFHHMFWSYKDNQCSGRGIYRIKIWDYSHSESGRSLYFTLPIDILQGVSYIRIHYIHYMFSNCFSLWETIISLQPHISQPHSNESQVSINYITLLLSTHPSYPPIPLTPLHYSTSFGYNSLGGWKLGDWIRRKMGGYWQFLSYSPFSSTNALIAL